MPDGLWGGSNIEPVNQSATCRERYLTVNTATANPLYDASGEAAFSPRDLPERGPHFSLAPKTADGHVTRGMEFLITGDNAGAVPAVAGAGGFTVTVWKLVNTLQVGGYFGGIPPWGSLRPLTGVQFHEWYRSFDFNACIIRFQVVPDYAGGGSDGSIIIAINEL